MLGPRNGCVSSPASSCSACAAALRRGRLNRSIPSACAAKAGGGPRLVSGAGDDDQRLPTGPDERRRGPTFHPDGLRVAFQLPDGRIKWVLPSRLDSADTVYAMTVHKAGLRFSRTLLVLPDHPHPARS